MGKLTRRILTIMMVMLLAMTVLIGCDPGVKIEVEGTWEISGGYGTEKWIISSTEIRYLFKGTEANAEWKTTYAAEVIEYDNEKFNDSTVEENCGYAVIKYKAGDTANADQDGKFNIFRWKIKDDKADFTQGYKSDNSHYQDSAENAKTKITTANGHFGAYSAGAEKK